MKTHTRTATSPASRPPLGLSCQGRWDLLTTIPPHFNFIHRAVKSARVARCFKHTSNSLARKQSSLSSYARKLRLHGAKQFSQVQELTDKSALKHRKDTPKSPSLHDSQERTIMVPSLRCSVLPPMTTAAAQQNQC